MEHSFLLDLEPRSWFLLTHSAPGSCSQINAHALQLGSVGVTGGSPGAWWARVIGYLLLPLRPGRPGSVPLRPRVLLWPWFHVAGVRSEQTVRFGGRWHEAALANRSQRDGRVRTQGALTWRRLSAAGRNMNALRAARTPG